MLPGGRLGGYIFAWPCVIWNPKIQGLEEARLNAKYTQV